MELSRQRKWQLKKKSNGLCTICGKKPLKTETLCHICNLRKQMAAKIKYAEKIQWHVSQDTVEDGK